MRAVTSAIGTALKSGTGRGEFVRLAFEATGTKYNDVKDPAKFSTLIGPGHAHFAPPLLRLEQENGTVISQTPNILQYLGEEVRSEPKTQP